MSSFSQFPLLPIEIQLRIWRFALEVQEGHIVPIQHLRYGTPRKFKPHVLYFVNNDSRRTYLNFHKKNMARYPRLKTVVFDARIDTVLLLVPRPFLIAWGMRRLADKLEKSVSKDIRNFAIGGIHAQYFNDFSRGMPSSAAGAIFRVLPSVRCVTFAVGDVDDEMTGERKSIIGLEMASQERLFEGNPTIWDYTEPLIKTTLDKFEQLKRRKRPDWEIPRVQAMLAIHGGIDA